MKCSDIKLLIIDVLENPSAIDPELQKQFFEHIKKCPNCADEFEKLKALNNKLLQVKPIKPDSNLKNEFSAKLEKEKFNSGNSLKFLIQNSYKIAAGILLFIMGSLFGYYFTQINKVAHLRQELEELKHSYTSTILREQTTSAKIKAINYFNGKTSIDDDFIHILDNILNYDDNVNVRLAAAKALFKYSHQEKVKSVLVKSLKNQSEPMVQIELINGLIYQNKSEAIHYLETIINNKNSNSIVKQYAENKIKILI